VIASTKFRIGGAARNRTGDGRFAGPSPVVFASRSFELSRPKSHLLNRLRRSLAPAHRGCRWLKLGAVGPWRAQFGHSSTSALIKFDHSAVTPYCALGVEMPRSSRFQEPPFFSILKRVTLLTSLRSYSASGSSSTHGTASEWNSNCTSGMFSRHVNGGACARHKLTVKPPPKSTTGKSPVVCSCPTK
jgi:hypothetical protein